MGRHNIALIYLSLSVTACGGGSSPPSSGAAGSTPPSRPPPPPLVGYTVGGAVSGLKGRGLTLDIFAESYTRPKSIQQRSIDVDGAFVFPTPIFTNGPDEGHIFDSAFDYAVGIAQQPDSPTQLCVLSDKYGLFTIRANITDLSVACGEFSYSTNTADNTISAFSVDAYTGALVSVGPPVATGRSPYAVASTADKAYLYVANGDSNDVSVFSADPRTGALTAIPGSPFAAGTRPRAIALFRSTLFVANAGSDNLSVYRVDPTSGVLALWSSGSFPTGSGPSVMAVVGGGGPYSFGPVLYIANGGSNDISAYWILGAYGPEQALESVQGSPFRSGSSISSLAFGRGFLYAANANGVDATISAFGIDPNTAALTSLAGFPFALPSCTYIAADRTGTYLYATAGTNLSGFSIDAQTGALSPLPGFPVDVGANADSISIGPTNQFLYIRNGSAGTVTGFQLIVATGELVPMPGSPFVEGRSPDFIATI